MVHRHHTSDDSCHISTGNADFHLGDARRPLLPRKYLQHSIKDASGQVSPSSVLANSCGASCRVGSGGFSEVWQKVGKQRRTFNPKRNGVRPGLLSRKHLCLQRLEAIADQGTNFAGIELQAECPSEICCQKKWPFRSSSSSCWLSSRCNSLSGTCSACPCPAGQSWKYCSSRYAFSLCRRQSCYVKSLTF